MKQSIKRRDHATKARHMQSQTDDRSRCGLRRWTEALRLRRSNRSESSGWRVPQPAEREKRSLKPDFDAKSPSGYSIHWVCCYENRAIFTAASAPIHARVSIAAPDNFTIINFAKHQEPTHASLKRTRDNAVRATWQLGTYRAASLTGDTQLINAVTRYNSGGQFFNDSIVETYAGNDLIETGAVNLTSKVSVPSGAGNDRVFVGTVQTLAAAIARGDLATDPLGASTEQSYLLLDGGAGNDLVVGGDARDVLFGCYSKIIAARPMNTASKGRKCFKMGCLWVSLPFQNTQHSKRRRQRSRDLDRIQPDVQICKGFFALSIAARSSP